MCQVGMVEVRMTQRDSSVQGCTGYHRQPPHPLDLIWSPWRCSKSLPSIGLKGGRDPGWNRTSLVGNQEGKESLLDNTVPYRTSPRLWWSQQAYWRPSRPCSSTRWSNLQRVKSGFGCHSIYQDRSQCIRSKPHKAGTGRVSKGTEWNTWCQLDT